MFERRKDTVVAEQEGLILLDPSANQKVYLTWFKRTYDFVREKIQKVEKETEKRLNGRHESPRESVTYLTVTFIRYGATDLLQYEAKKDERWLGQAMGRLIASIEFGMTSLYFVPRGDDIPVINESTTTYGKKIQEFRATKGEKNKELLRTRVIEIYKQTVKARGRRNPLPRQCKALFVTVANNLRGA